MVSLYNDDCRTILPQIKDHSVDFILTDPPYNIAEYSTGNIYLPGRKFLNNDIAKWDEPTIEPKDFLDDFKRILKPDGNIFIFTTYNLIGKWHEVFDKEFDTFTFFVWHKTNPTPKIFKNGFLNSCELVICLWDKGHKWNFMGQNEMHNFFETPNSSSYGVTDHPTEKPVKLMEHFIKICTDKGDTVLDCFMGSGTTGVACVNLGRNFIGIEKDAHYFQIAEQRCNGTYFGDIKETLDTEKVDLF